MVTPAVALAVALTIAPAMALIIPALVNNKELNLRRTLKVD